MGKKNKLASFVELEILYLLVCKWDFLGRRNEIKKISLLFVQFILVHPLLQEFTNICFISTFGDLIYQWTRAELCRPFEWMKKKEKLPSIYEYDFHLNSSSMQTGLRYLLNWPGTFWLLCFFSLLEISWFYGLIFIISFWFWSFSH